MLIIVTIWFSHLSAATLAAQVLRAQECEYVSGPATKPSEAAKARPTDANPALTLRHCRDYHNTVRLPV